ncbi:regulatory protein ArsR (plasmid) [Thermovibrio ammonificans HB-1]|uniref:Regulatory protein ArsR n=1 Tax=Thermovibrio ammonificans (strain DSM 15698 / JCM 12110 / HB-1) TaxID=648996 RepID=E8T6U3_THEA1|nr:metalloregulator ArsR/SmtB family transcription factor [Thermovibrio ammonificans]ADU97766.1 regulatory protein ArsR [Thermovibrio ammonificans HB-1]
MKTATGVDRATLEEVVDVLRAAAHPLRLAVLFLLKERGETWLTELYLRLGVPQSSLSQHISWLRGAGLIRRRRKDNRCYYALTPIGASVLEAVEKILKEVEK